MVILTRHINTPENYDLELPGRGTLQDKMYVGFVKVTNDVLRMGRLKVWIPELSGDPNDENGWFIVTYCSPFAGATNILDSKNENNYQSTQKSYGMWFVPPDINNEVVCAFINGDPGRGIWLGCLYQDNMNHMVPGIPGNDSSASAPVAEYNKKITTINPTKPDRPIYSPLADQLAKQGLDSDTIRGVTDSGARRDDPVNMVYGILTPGGHQFVFDDSPTNSHIRLRTQQGAQILINDTVGSIYLNSVDGKNWVSLDANGRIDLYGYGDISIRSQGSLNLRADRDVNIEAGQNINMKARGDVIRTPQVNPASDGPPPTPPIGNITVIGDSVAAGVSLKIPNNTPSAQVGDTSAQILDRIQTQLELKNFVNAILSVAADESGPGLSVNAAVITNNATQIRGVLSASNYVWLLPYEANAKAAIQTVAQTNNDQMLDLSRYPTVDNVHPRDYALVANDALALCRPSPEVQNIAAGGNGAVQTSGIGQTPYGTYNIGTYRTLDEAQDAQSRYRSAADFARANPNYYSPEEYRTVLRFEAAADAEVARLSGQNATTPAAVQAAQPAPVGPVSPGAAAPSPLPATTGVGSAGTPGAVPPPGQDAYSICQEFLERMEGFNRGIAYWDPANQRVLVSIGYGHQIKPHEYAQGYIDTGPTGRVAVSRPNSGANPPIPQTITQEQARSLKRIDLRAYGATTRRLLGAGSWDALGPYQQAALMSYCYNIPAGITKLVSEGINGFIAQNDIESAAKLIENGIATAGGRPNAGLRRRRLAEANLYRQRPDLTGAGAGPTTIGGETIPGTGTGTAASGGIVVEDSAIQNGYIKIQSRNSMHFLSGQYMFMTSEKDMHRLSGGSIFDTASKNVDRVAGGYMHESVNKDYSITSATSINLYAPRININGGQPTPAVAAVSARGPGDLKQSDGVLNSIGNLQLLLTDTIMPHLPFHEPYDNHGGRNFEPIRDATNLNETLNLRDGEVITNSTAPLDIYGTPRNDMPPAVYRGIGFNSQNRPLYQYEAPLGNVALQPVTGFTISEPGKQFIKARENGSYSVIVVGQPPKREVGYGHELTPAEISQNSVNISGAPISLSIPLTQPQINRLFDEDIEKVETWMKPSLGNLAVTQTQYDMLCSLAFNIGENNFKSSPAIKAAMDGNIQEVPNNWMKHSRNAIGVVVPGLLIRRRAEVTRFIAGPDVDRIPSISDGSNILIDNGGSVVVSPSPAT